MLALVNQRRRAAKLAPVRASSPLRSPARRASVVMARGGSFAHDGLRWARGRAAGQNLAMASNARVAVSAMMASPPHRKNILGSGFRFAGVGAARTCDGVIYFTLNMAGSTARR